MTGVTESRLWRLARNTRSYNGVVVVHYMVSDFIICRLWLMCACVIAACVVPPLICETPAVRVRVPSIGGLLLTFCM